jgi:hypothetical protein
MLPRSALIFALGKSATFPLASARRKVMMKASQIVLLIAAG